MLKTALADLADPPKKAPLPMPSPELVAAGDRERLPPMSAERMEEAGISPMPAARPRDRRAPDREGGACQRAARARGLSALQAFLRSAPRCARPGDALRAFAGDAGISLGAALESFGARARALSEHGLPDERSSTTPASAARSTIIPAWSSRSVPGGADRPLAGGGRYDRLLTLLGAEKPIPGVGFSVWLDRVEQLRGGA
jgi:ATP phosphoribosyltransferase regulatory subunit